MKVKIWSAMALKDDEVKKIRYVMENSRNCDRDLSNQFPQRFKRREGNKIFFDIGKRRYCTEIEVAKHDG